MSRLNGRITKLETQTRPERPVVIVGRDMAWDVTRGEPYTGDVEEAEVLFRINVDLEDFL